jgi:hypothetical protein
MTASGVTVLIWGISGLSRINAMWLHRKVLEGVVITLSAVWVSGEVSTILDFQRPIYITLDGYENKYIVPGSLGSAF